MAIEVRPARAEEMDAFAQLMRYAFANGGDAVPPIRPEWTLCAFVDGALATTSGAWPLTVRWNGTALQAAGVTCVSTAPEHRRQGLLRRVMSQALRDQHERGQCIALLWASLGAIYQRYGYGPASGGVTYRFDPRRVALHDPPRVTGSVERLTDDEILPVIKPIYIAHVAERMLSLHRSAAMWAFGPTREVPGRPAYAAVYRAASGEARGYAVYHTEGPSRPLAGDPPPNQTLHVRDFAALDHEAYCALWQHIQRHDLVRTVHMGPMPEDDPAPLLVAEPRELNRQPRDGLWLRVVDAERSLASRPYAMPAELSIRVRDDALCPWNEGTFRVVTEGDKSAVARTGDSPDVIVTPWSLATLLAGQASATQLYGAGRLDGKDPATLARADRMFATRHAPHCPDSF
jgi:predicted acetyltransferase